MSQTRASTADQVSSIHRSVATTNDHVETAAERPSSAAYEAAHAALAAGLCAVPPRQDGSKAPLGSWKNFQAKRPSVEQIDAWYCDGSRTGVGLVCGAISGGLELFELEGRAV